ncbi:MAG: phosphoglucosamine mutase [Acholeplasmataceae bacterium]|nr:phosphoglucosamine mutase [Acholeplasmataceae bacterium]
MKKHFGTDGIRGQAYTELNADLAFKIGFALKVLNNPYVIIGRDTRESGPMLAEGIKKGAKAAGINAIDVGVVSTPMLSYISGRQRTLGVMITASHNPYQDNGIKIFNSGRKLFAGEEEEIEAVLNDEVKVEQVQNFSFETHHLDPEELYLELYRDLLIPTPMKIGLDLANGATYEIGKIVFRQLTPYLSIISADPDGKNINDNCGSTHLEKLIALVREGNLELGFAFDGDGDRLMVVGEDGKVFDGDHLLYAFAVYLFERNLLKGNTVVLTKMSNLGLVKALKERGIKTVLTDIGDKYVLEALEENEYTLGGENSGHIINLHLLNTGDGLLNASYLLKVLRETGKSLDELTRDLVMYPDRTYNLRNVDKELAKDEIVLNKVKEIKERLGDEGKVIVRPSGTEPLIRITVSAPTQPEVDHSINEIVDTIINIRRGI